MVMPENDAADVAYVSEHSFLSYFIITHRASEETGVLLLASRLTVQATSASRSYVHAPRVIIMACNQIDIVIRSIPVILSIHSLSLQPASHTIPPPPSVVT